MYCDDRYDVNQWWRRRAPTARWFADDAGGDGGAAATGGAGTETADADLPAGEVDDADASEKPDAAAADDKPWYADRDWYDEKNEGILSKYKTPEDALKSIPDRERRLNDLKIDFPPDDAEAEDREKGHRAILKRMGAPKKAEAYRELAETLTKDLPDSVKSFLPEGFLDQCAEEAHDLGYLPWQFERHLAMALSHVEAHVRAQQDNRDTAEKSLKNIFGNKLDQVLGSVDKTCDLYDQDMFRDDNLKLPEQQRREQGGLVKRMWAALKSTEYGPLLARILNYNHDRLFSEGDGSMPGLRGEKTTDAYTVHYNDAKRWWPNSGEHAWKQYADDKLKGR